MKNDLSSLNNYLFEELERLNDDEQLKTDENLEKEIKRSKAITSVAQAIINNANTVLKAVQIQNNQETLDNTNITKLLGNKSE